MKILHTSDWHLGHMLYDYDRSDEQKDMLRQIAGIVAQHKPDVFLLCGDVFHTSQPSAAVQTMFTRALIQIRKANPSMTIVAIAGNHDSGTKHEIFREAWNELNVFSIGNIDIENIERQIIKIDGKGYIVAVPYCYERNIPDGFYQKLLDAVAHSNSENLPVVMAAHTTISGCDFNGHDKATEYTVGGIDSFDLTKLGEGYDYLALGHIHRPQYIGNKHNVRYSGTPRPVSFDERFAHSVSIVTIEKTGQTPEIEEIPIVNPRNLVNLPAQGAATWDEAKTLLRQFPDNESAYIRLNVEIDDYLPSDATAEAQSIAKEKKCRFCYINAIRKNRLQQSDSKTLTIEEFKNEKPIDIAARYASDTGKNFDNDMRELFEETVRLVEEEGKQS